MYFDRFDIAAAYYRFLADNHEGQGSEKYARLCKMDRYYKPGLSEQRYETLNDNARAIYDRLTTNEYAKGNI